MSLETPWVRSLLTWFSKHQREMPWRRNPSPYHTWISEIMLQQTQVVTVIPYFQRFIQSFPSLESLAKADQDDVLKHWEGLGYYSRARNLHKTAQLLVESYQAVMPSDFEELQRLPGIGFYTAAAISSIAFEKPVPVVDGNVLRVFTRFWGIYDDIRHNQVKTMLFHKLESYIKEAKPSDFNQAIMECGALICQPQSPSCMVCPLQQDCFAYANHKQAELPVKSPAKTVPTLDVVVGVVIHDNQLLIAKRPDDKMLGGLWELPGGKIESKESPEQALQRELKEEVNLDVCVGKKLVSVKHAYSHFKINLHAYECEIIRGIPVALSAIEIKWVFFDDLKQYAFPKATIKIFDWIAVKKKYSFEMDSKEQIAINNVLERCYKK
tara:strand:- start:223 stop:1365 length:1143 start_codon:yes stop_codon:yes gene_type:complete